MAHSLKYWYEQKQKDGRIVRLEILQKDYADAPMEIGPVVQGLHLDIQGQTEDIDAPIVKTSLTMTFVDAPDHEEAATKKCGDWIEFYTPDSTAWRVILKATDSDGAFYDVWSGYITPDSYSEELRYRGSVSVIARDNIGHMQDFTFDKADFAAVEFDTGKDMVSLYYLIEIASDKAGILMDISYGNGNHQLKSNGGDWAIFTLMNASAFEGMNYYDAIEKVLYSLGMVMRYVGENTIVICPIRYLPFFKKDYITQVDILSPIFEAYATRELAPAVKKIEETVDYDIEKIEFPVVGENEFTGEKDMNLVQGNSVDKLSEGWYIENTTSGYGWCNPDYPLFFNPHGYTFKYGDEDKNLTWIGANTYDIDSLFSKIYAEYSRYIVATSLEINITFGQVYFLTSAGVLYASSDQIKSCILYIKVVNDGNTYYLQQDGTWGTSIAKYKMDIPGGRISLPIGFGENISGSALLAVQIVRVLTEEGAAQPRARYIPIREASFSQGTALREKNSVNTIYDENNNVILTRDPDFGPSYDNVFLPEIIKNGFFIGGASEGEYHPAKEWGWTEPAESEEDMLQLAAYIHMQLLCYHSKPNNIISGTIVNADVTTPAAIYEWRGSKHILVGGSMNFLSGHIEGATLREFLPYAKMWLPHTDIDFAEVSYEGGNVYVQFFADDDYFWEVVTPDWITANITSGSGSAVITLQVDSTRIERGGEVYIGPAVVKIVQKAVGHFNTDYNDDFHVFRDFGSDYFIGDIN